MDKFTNLTGIAAPLPIINVDTDMIVPKQYLKTILRTGLGRILFDEMRHKADGTEIADFVLNKAPYRDAKILVSGPNFGCGSSREHAPWALKDFGIKAIIAPSFADIFFNNCFKNGILPIVLDAAQVDKLMADAQSANPTLTIDLEAQAITRPDGTTIAFTVEPAYRRALLEGLDEIGLSLQYAQDVDRFEELQYRAQPWLFTKHANA
jgi:3-isopropylmalate/(R)-2-methylmalate dehydratase small subunit